MLGFLGDVGDLAKLVQGKAGVTDRARTSTRPSAHELADCLWSVLTLADAYDVDLVGAFTSTHGRARRGPAPTRSPDPLRPPARWISTRASGSSGPRERLHAQPQMKIHP